MLARLVVDGPGLSLTADVLRTKSWVVEKV